MKRVPMICKIASSVMAITSMVMPLIGVAQEPKVSSKYTLFAPSMNKQQTIDIQKKSTRSYFSKLAASKSALLRLPMTMGAR